MVMMASEQSVAQQIRAINPLTPLRVTRMEPSNPVRVARLAVATLKVAIIPVPAVIAAMLVRPKVVTTPALVVLKARKGTLALAMAQTSLVMVTV